MPFAASDQQDENKARFDGVGFWFSVALMIVTVSGVIVQLCLPGYRRVQRELQDLLSRVDDGVVYWLRMLLLESFQRMHGISLVPEYIFDGDDAECDEEDPAVDVETPRPLFGPDMQFSTEHAEFRKFMLRAAGVSLENLERVSSSVWWAELEDEEESVVTVDAGHDDVAGLGDGGQTGDETQPAQNPAVTEIHSIYEREFNAACLIQRHVRSKWVRFKLNRDRMAAEVRGRNERFSAVAIQRWIRATFDRQEIHIASIKKIQSWARLVLLQRREKAAATELQLGAHVGFITGVETSEPYTTIQRYPRVFTIGDQAVVVDVTAATSHTGVEVQSFRNGRIECNCYVMTCKSVTYTWIGPPQPCLVSLPLPNGEQVSVNGAMAKVYVVTDREAFECGRLEQFRTMEDTARLITYDADELTKIWERMERERMGLERGTDDTSQRIARKRGIDQDIAAEETAIKRRKDLTHVLTDPDDELLVSTGCMWYQLDKWGVWWELRGMGLLHVYQVENEQARIVQRDALTRDVLLDEVVHSVEQWPGAPPYTFIVNGRIALKLGDLDSADLFEENVQELYLANEDQE